MIQPHICERPHCNKVFEFSDGFITPEGALWCPDCGEEYKLYQSAPGCTIVHQ